MILTEEKYVIPKGAVATEGSKNSINITVLSV